MHWNHDEHKDTIKKVKIEQICKIKLVNLNSSSDETNFFPSRINLDVIKNYDECINIRSLLILNHHRRIAPGLMEILSRFQKQSKRATFVYFNNNSTPFYANGAYIEGLKYYYYCVNSGRRRCMCRQNSNGAIALNVLQSPREKHTEMDSAPSTTLWCNGVFVRSIFPARVF